MKKPSDFRGSDFIPVVGMFLYLNRNAKNRFGLGPRTNDDFWVPLKDTNKDYWIYEAKDFALGMYNLFAIVGGGAVVLGLKSLLNK